MNKDENSWIYVAIFSAPSSYTDQIRSLLNNGDNGGWITKGPEVKGRRMFITEFYERVERKKFIDILKDSIPSVKFVSIHSSPIGSYRPRETLVEDIVELY